jgi:hypothetical protein
LRKRRGICQSQPITPTRSSIDFSYLSKVECGLTLLSLGKLLPLAKASGSTAVIVVLGPDRITPNIADYVEFENLIEILCRNSFC